MKPKTKEEKEAEQWFKFMFWCAVIFLIGVLVGNLYYKSQIDRPQRIRENYNYCVTGCTMSSNFEFIIANQSEYQEVLEYLGPRLVSNKQKIKHCESECEKVLQENNK